jgi:hypothetical protein
LSPYLILPLVRAILCRAIPLLRQELREVFVIEDRDERADLAFQRESEPHDRYEIRRPASALKFANARLRESATLREVYLR